MFAYILRRLLLIVPTLIGIMIINFIVIQFAPGGPVEQVLAEMRGNAAGATAAFSGQAGDLQSNDAPVGNVQSGNTSTYRGAQGLDPAIIAEIEQQFGFDKPVHERFFNMLWDYARFDFGSSYFRDETVINLVLDKMPVSISLGLWTTLFVYLISIPLGIRKAVKDGSSFDVWSSGAIVLGYAIPGFLFAILLIIVFAGGRYFDFFPLRGLTSPGWENMAWPERIMDYFWHITLPVTAMVISGFASLTMLTKNSFLDQISMQYVQTARAKGLNERQVLYGHVFRNAMLIVVAGFPAAFVSVFFGSSLLIEVIFSLDGLGRLGFEAAVKRDYPVMFGTLYVFGMLGLLMAIISDLMYVWIDPRIDFESRDT